MLYQLSYAPARGVSPLARARPMVWRTRARAERVRGIGGLRAGPRVGRVGVLECRLAMSSPTSTDSVVLEAFVRDRVLRAVEVIGSLGAQSARIGAIGSAIAGALARDGRVYTLGNGGSAAEALHLAEELIGKYKSPRAPLAGVCLNADPTALTCIANDYGYDEVFARQVEGLAREGDVVVVFSTSGKSANILRALDAARERGATTIGLLGKGGGPALPLCDHALVVQADETEHIQEAHQVVLHLILEIVEARVSNG